MKTIGQMLEVVNGTLQNPHEKVSRTKLLEIYVWTTLCRLAGALPSDIMQHKSIREAPMPTPEECRLVGEADLMLAEILNDE